MTSNIRRAPVNINSPATVTLGDGTLENNKSKHFKFGDAASCANDIKVTFEDADGEAIWKNIDLCKIEKLTLRYDRQSKQVTAEAD